MGRSELQPAQAKQAHDLLPQGTATPHPIDSAIARQNRSHGEQADPPPDADRRTVGVPGGAAPCPADPRILVCCEETERHPHGGELRAAPAMRRIEHP